MTQQTDAVPKPARPAADLDERYTLRRGRILVSGTQALVRLRCGESFLLARVTHRSLHALGVAPGTKQ